MVVNLWMCGVKRVYYWLYLKNSVLQDYRCGWVEGHSLLKNSSKIDIIGSMSLEGRPVSLPDRLL